ncbi:secretion-regulating guanine nucleotide exchange factor isoform X1 [Cervus canadensis]|uniref:secretion-regulating guanine nucleotide exchange factor isoform X1 n=1 Tax=Cervus canadensis TaxID=1574408 RepID=UPI001C9E78CC|nr:secretion-regulating guanine nucleotide exchange factor isoform X1 [Cervus canadensis]
MESEPRASEAVPTAAALFAWGANSYGQLGLGHKEDVLSAQQLNDFCKPGCIKRITGGGGHSAVVTDEGSLFVCGLNKDGQLGLGHTEEVLYFTPCRSLLGCAIQQVACGWDFTIILTENGQVLSCGSNSFGQLGVPHGPRRCVIPQAIELLREKVVSIAAGLRHALASTARGTVFQWGTGLASSGRRLCPGQTLPLFLTAKEPSTVTGLENSQAVCVLAGSDHSASLTDAGELYVWGSNKHGQLASQAAFLLLPQRIEAHYFQNEKIAAVWSGWTHLVAQTVTGKVFTWGRADYGQLGRTVETREGWQSEKQDPSLPGSGPQKGTPSCLPCLTGATEISCGSEHNLAVIGPRRMGSGEEQRCWGPISWIQILAPLLMSHVALYMNGLASLCLLKKILIERRTLRLRGYVINPGSLRKEVAEPGMDTRRYLTLKPIPVLPSPPNQSEFLRNLSFGFKHKWLLGRPHLALPGIGIKYELV